MKLIDLSGSQFGRLTVGQRAGTSKNGHALWHCRCSCNETLTCFGANLLRGHTTSCGCLLKELKADPADKVMAKYKAGAYRREYEFALTDEEFRKLISETCFYCGVVPSHQIIAGRNGRKHPTFRYNGIDRVDNSRGYISDNVVTCCGPCNKAKGVMTHSDFVAYLDRVSLYRQGMQK